MQRKPAVGTLQMMLSLATALSTEEPEGDFKAC